MVLFVIQRPTRSIVVLTSKIQDYIGSAYTYIFLYVCISIILQFLVQSNRVKKEIFIQFIVKNKR
jgi:uncharacterized membrane protein YcgQ (UPF0703/DUF1980 family)